MLDDLEEIDDVRIYPKAFTREETKDSINHAFKYCESFFIGFRAVQRNIGQKIDLKESVITFCNFLEIGRVQKASHNVRILHYRRNELPRELIDNY